MAFGAKKNRAVRPQKTRRKLTCAWVRRQRGKAKHCVFAALRHSGKGRILETVKGSGVAGADRWSAESVQDRDPIRVMVTWWLPVAVPLSKYNF